MGSDAGERGGLPEPDDDLQSEAGEPIAETVGALGPVRRWLGREIEREDAGSCFLDSRHPGQRHLEQETRRNQLRGFGGTFHPKRRTPRQRLHRRHARCDATTGSEGIAAQHDRLPLRVIDQGDGKISAAPTLQRLEPEITTPDHRVACLRLGIPLSSYWLFHPKSGSGALERRRGGLRKTQKTRKQRHFRRGLLCTMHGPRIPHILCFFVFDACGIYLGLQ